MALGRSAIRNVDGQTTISNTATSFRTTLSDILASVTKTALINDIIQVRAGSTSILKFNFLLGAILPGPGLSKAVPYPPRASGVQAVAARRTLRSRSAFPTSFAGLARHLA